MSRAFASASPVPNWPTASVGADPRGILSSGLVCTSGAAQRGLMKLALDHWQECRSARAGLPSADDIDFRHPDLGNYFYVVRGSAAMADAVVQRSGPALAVLCDRDVEGHYMSEVLSRETAPRRLEFLRTAARVRKPLADSGSYERSDGIQLHFQQVVMPLQSDSISCLVLGAICFRLASSDQSELPD